MRYDGVATTAPHPPRAPNERLDRLAVAGRQGSRAVHRSARIASSRHLTPPFLGQGLCSGLRDAANLAWKLDLVLRGVAPERLLDTVEAERAPQNEAIIRLASELGKFLCELDPQAAAQRDVMLRSAGPPPPVELAPLSAGPPAPADRRTRRCRRDAERASWSAPVGRAASTTSSAAASS